MKEKLISCSLFVHSEEHSERLTNLLSMFSYIKLTGCMHNFSEAMENTIKHKPLIIFMDVEEAELLKHFQHNNFIVGICDKKQAKKLNNYLKIGFFDFLVTPIDGNEFRDVMGKILNMYSIYCAAKETYRMEAAENNIPYNLGLQDNKGNSKDFVFVSGNNKNESFKLYYDDVVYLELVKELVMIHFENGSTKTIKKSLRYFQSILPNDKFLKISRNFVIHLEKVNKVSKNEVVMTGNIKIQTTRIFKKELKGRLHL